jgi:DNA repair exonuclease SbcCD ATPase subunit
MQANVPITTGVLRFDQGSEIPLTVTDKGLEGELLVMREGAYVIEVEDTHGLKNLRPPHYTVQLLPDRHPTVHLQQPQDGLEVDETTELHLDYEAEDDFGLQDATLVYFGPDSAEQRLPLHTGHFERRRVQETFTWDMREWPLPAGKTVQFYIEVYDNDTISGPKKGVSQTLTLTIRNREQEHQNLEKQQEEIANALLDLLGDHLELADQIHAWRQPTEVDAASRQEALHQMDDKQQQAMARTGELAERVQEALDHVQRDPYSTYETFSDMQAMQRNLDYLHNTLMSQLQESMQSIDPQAALPAQLDQPEAQLEEVVQELERLASLAEDTATGEKFNDLMNISTKMLEQQNQLLASLADLPQDLQGGELPPEVQEMLDRLDQLMQELADAVTRLPKTLPDEFLNRQLDTLPLSNMAQQLQKLRQKLAEGDLDAATQLAKEVLKTLSMMVGALQNMLQQARSTSMDAMSQQLQQSSDKLADLIRRQEQLLEETQGIDHDALRQLNQAQQRAFEAAQQYLHQELSKLTRLSWELSRQARQHPELTLGFQQAYRELLQRAQELRRHFNARNMPQAMQELEAAQRQMTWMAQQIARLPQPDSAMQQQASRAMERLQAIRQRIDRLPHDRTAMLTPGQRQHLGKLAEQQGQVRGETQDLHQAFEQLMPLMPFLPAEMGQHLQESIPFMGQASTELEGRRSQPAIPPEQQALEHLRNAQNGLQQALQQMAQRGQMMGMSLPMLRQTGRLPTGFPPPQVNQSARGVAGSSVRNFQLPDKEAYKVPRMFREDIVEALKEGYPTRYKELIEQYYRNIIR